MQQFIDGIQLRDLLTVGYRNLKKNMNAINDLNVFPVPDGDTGTNMVHTFGGGLNATPTHAQVGEDTTALSQAVLLCARGNSGVIFSQFIRGLARGFEGKEQICFGDLAAAFACATEDTYKSILTPTEGTILTVIREAGEYLAADGAAYADFETGLPALLGQMRSTLEKTPDMLPVLKEAGVVDSGGAGLLCFFEGIHAYFTGVAPEDIEDMDTATPTTVTASAFGPDSVMEYGYCTEFILQLMHAKTDLAAFDVDAFVQPLHQLGDSIVAVESGGIVKIHIHTFTPEQVLAYARTYGEFVTIKIENMSVQHSEIQATPTPAAPKEKVKYAVIAVASGQGIVDYFQSIGASAVINGGQTNNPPVEAFLEAFDRFEAEHIVVLPNNSNILLTARQAADIYTAAPVHILPTKSIVEGYSALSMMNLWCDTVEELLEDMGSGLPTVTSGYITTATRDATIGGVQVTKGQYVGMRDKEMVLCHPDRFAAATDLIRSVMQEGEKAVVIVFHGAAVDAAEVDALRTFLEDEYPLVDIGFIDGRQDVYDYMISFE